MKYCHNSCSDYHSCDPRKKESMLNKVQLSMWSLNGTTQRSCRQRKSQWMIMIDTPPPTEVAGGKRGKGKGQREREGKGKGKRPVMNVAQVWNQAQLMHPL